MLLAHIKSNYSSGGESSSDIEEADNDTKSSKKVKKVEEDEEQQGSIRILSRFCKSRSKVKLNWSFEPYHKHTCY